MLHANQQVEFGVPKRAESPSCWQAVVDLLDLLCEDSTPNEIGRALLQAGQRIHQVFFEEHGYDCAPLAADDVMPIAIYCCFYSNLSASIISGVSQISDCGEKGDPICFKT